MIRWKTIRWAFVALMLASCMEAVPVRNVPPPESAVARVEPPDEFLAPPPPTLPFTEDRIIVAVLLPLSGPQAQVGNALLDAAGLALFNAYDPRVTLVPFDTTGTPEGAKIAAENAATARANIIIGPLFSTSVRAVAPIARNARIPVLSFSNDSTVAQNGVWVLGFRPWDEVGRVVGYARQNGHEEFAALIPETRYGREVLDVFSRATLSSGGAVTGLETYRRNPEALFDPVRRLADYARRRNAYLAEERFLKALNDDLADEFLKDMEAYETLGEASFDAVLVPEGGALLKTLAPVLPFFEIDPAKVRFLGTGLWFDQSILNEPPLASAWFAGPEPDPVFRFEKDFETLYGYTPPRVASLAYDAMALITARARHEIRRERFSSRSMMDPNGFLGVNGLFRLKPSGVTERRLAVLEISREGFKVIDPAPVRFRN